jgi:DNA-binding response OmpR family regulator
MKLLLIEDEVKTLLSLKQGLEEEQWDVDIAYDGTIGFQLALRNDYALIISDIILPGMNGLDLCRKLRTADVTTPILLLTALGTIDDKIDGLDAGADDYLAKPFELRELLARVRALTRRSAAQPSYTGSTLTLADLTLNPDTKLVTRAGQEITLTAKEFQLLDYLLRNQSRVVSKAELGEKIWDVTFDTGTNVIEVYVNFLRKKIDRDFEPKLLHTQIGMGYVLKVMA